MVKFKQYENLSSKTHPRTRYSNGGLVDIKAKKLGWWERATILEDFSDYDFLITKEYEFRPDLVSYDQYNNNNYEWVILTFNSIVDIQEEFVVGRIIRLPTLSRVVGDLVIRRFA